MLLLNGPNLNLLGKREPEIYGSTTLQQIEADLKQICSAQNIQLECFQSNFEGALVDKIHAAIDNQVAGILINSGAFTHTSIALRDALLGVGIPYVELHLSNTFAREQFRQHSYLADGAVGVVIGFGPASYRLALDGLLSYLQKSREV